MCTGEKFVNLYNGVLTLECRRKKAKRQSMVLDIAPLNDVQ